MEKLNQNWITEKHTDFEYKKYLLLAYLQKIDAEFRAQRMYPALLYLETEYEQMKQLKAAFSILENRLSKNIKDIDIQNFKLVYHSIFEDDKMMHDIIAIIHFSMPLLEQYIQKAREIIQTVEQHIAISPIGLTPLICKEGYLFLHAADENQTKIYHYQLTFYENSTAHYRGVNTQFIGEYQRSISGTYEFMKLDLIKNNSHLPNPATYLVDSEVKLPVEFTFLPLAKIKLAKMIN